MRVVHNINEGMHNINEGCWKEEVATMVAYHVGVGSSYAQQTAGAHSLPGLQAQPHCAPHQAAAEVGPHGPCHSHCIFRLSRYTCSLSLL